ncbi:unannotated protein [freshwater metagenome]|uniref:Unannotated protein n=1 Tax=freshwater metagenome TaxID=449393 RepID=A0A6J6B2A0_9ZZZZ|nr:hypothetical protein [Actinomycetota bacterium]
MKYLLSLIVGGVTAVAATFLHKFAPPFGIAISIIGTFTSIWVIGRIFAGRRFKIIAAIGWIAIFFRAASFGVGKELLVQGDNLGNAFFLISFAALAIAIAFPAN